MTLGSNTTFDFVTFLINVNSQGDLDFCEANEGGLILPNVTLQIEDNAGGVLAMLDTGDIPFSPNPEWTEFKLTFSTPASTSSVQVVLINNSIGGCENDHAIDDISFRVAVTIEAVDDTVTLTNTDNATPAALTLDDIIYTISVANSGLGQVGSDTLVLVDIMPPELEFYNDDIDGAAGTEVDPVKFEETGSGLDFTYGTDVAFSDAGTKPTTFGGCTYSPTVGGYDSAVRFICFNPEGTMLAGSTWSVSFRARIK